MFRIKSALKPNAPLTRKQRTSGMFTYEPMVAGKTIRRTIPSVIIDAEAFKRDRVNILRLFDAELITIEVQADEEWIPFGTTIGALISAPVTEPDPAVQTTEESDGTSGATGDSEGQAEDPQPADGSDADPGEAQSDVTEQATEPAPEIAPEPVAETKAPASTGRKNRNSSSKG